MKYLVNHFNSLNSNQLRHELFHNLVVATAGGAISALAGGSFELGFLTAGVAFAANELVTSMEEARLERKHDELEERTVKFAKDNPDKVIPLSKEDQQTIVDYEIMEAINDSTGNFKEDMVYADTFIYNRDLGGRIFNVEGFGHVLGGNYNYLSVGIMGAHYGINLFSSVALNVGWNLRDIVKGKGWYNYDQMFQGSFWSGVGRYHYQNSVSGGG